MESEQFLEAKGRELASINEQLAEARLAALQAQMNPHFVFNALNSIKRMILDGDNRRASKYLTKFALMIRMTLNHSRDPFVSLEESIEYLKTYLDMEQLRFDDSFSYSIFTDEHIDATETAIPSLMIQPLVENAIWHGLLPAGTDKKIIIGFTQQQNKITCTIEDNGIGIRQSEKLKEVNRPLHSSVGLENLRKRIKIMNEKYDTDCSLDITDLGESGMNGRGTRVVLQFNALNT
jgi:sensor histidine kinase YesM